MGTRRRLATLVLLLTAVGALAAGARADVIQSGDVRVNFHAAFSPVALPREKQAPITVEVGGKISTTDGSHPPALKQMRVELNSAGKIETEGLPTCKASLLQSTDVAEARSLCGAAQVGTGTFQAQIAFAEKPIVVNGRALVFNGTIGRHPEMLIHIYIATPVRVTLVIPIKISRQKGQFGTVLTTNVPSLAAGFGSITELQLKIGREYRYRGVRRSYLSAACAAPPGFPGAPFSFARGNFTFSAGHTLHTTLTRNCKVRK
jgi:hypothetical protein